MSSRSYSVRIALCAFAFPHVCYAQAQPLDPARLFTSPEGVLSPGYSERHSVSSGKPLEAVNDQPSRSYIALLVNPALAPLGKWSGRLEIALLLAHALYVEASVLNFNTSVRGYDLTLRSHAFDIGYHLFPLGRGLEGFYLGPRVVIASGSTDVALGSFVGYGGDIGYQFVLGPVALNIGVGAAYGHVHLEAAPGVAERFDVPAARRAELEQTIDQPLVVPLATLGLGIVF